MAKSRGLTGARGGRARGAKAPQQAPSRDEILAFLAEHPGQAGKRELARAFGISGSGRIALKRALRELEDDGVIERRRKRLVRSGELPEIFVALIAARDADGELLGEPAEWDEEEHDPPPRVSIVSDAGRRAGPAPGIGDRALVRRIDCGGDLPEGVSHAARIMRVLDRRPAQALGVVRRTPGGARIVPVDRRGREIVVADADLKDAEDGDLVALDLTRSGRLGLPRAKVRERIGPVGSEKAVSLIAIHAHGIPHVFPAAALAEAAVMIPAGPEGRENWTALPLVTIDPADAKDHDDAVHAEPDPDPANPGGWIVTVAIADVAHYVRPGSALDREARHRGNSVYFPDRVVPMLPERISNDLCSLRAGEDRAAIAVRMVFAADGRKLRHAFHRILMRSAAKLAYGQAQAAIDGRPDEATASLLQPVLRPLWSAYECLKRGRVAREPLELDLPERKILLDADGRVERVIVPERLDSHRLIEEFMIQANVAAAETLEKHRVPLLYRIHDEPSLEKLDALRDFLETLGISFPRQGALKPARFNVILVRVAETPNAALVNEVMLRAQAQAEYSPVNIGHFGLNLRRYAHFTSPIRRYADLVVHRGLIRACRLGAGGLPETIDEKLEAIGAEVSAAERRAMAAERDTIDRLIAHWLADRVGTEFRGRVSGVTKAGLFVRLEETGADGFIPISTLGQDFFVHDEAAHALVGRQTRETFGLGDAVQVRLVEAQPFAGALRFELLSHGRQASADRGKRQAPRGRGARAGAAMRRGRSDGEVR